MYSEDQNREFQAFLEKLPQMSDAELSKACENFIWLSAYANNNPRSNYHRMCDACPDECQRRGKPEIYTAAHKRVSGVHGGRS